MSNKLFVPEQAGLVAPTAAVLANETRKRTLIPCLFTTGLPPHLVFAKTLTPERNYHRLMHVMPKGADAPLCRCKAPEGYDTLHGLSQAANAAIMTADRQTVWWHRLMWCAPCTTFAGWLVRRA